MDTLSEKYIKATEEYSTFERAVAAPYLRKTFTLEEAPERASLSLTCTGFYRLWINGKEITCGRLAPYITNPDLAVFYDSYRLEEYLTKGKNCIGLLLGNGLSNNPGGMTWGFDRAPFRSSPRLALYFLAEGSFASVSFEADESFLCAPSPILFDDYRCGEHFDSRQEKEGWNLPEYDDSGWTPAIPAEAPLGKKLTGEAERVRIIRQVKALRVFKGKIDPELFGAADRRPDFIKRCSEGSFYRPDEREEGYIYEFPENTSFIPKLKIKGERGQRIVLQVSERCDEAGALHFANPHEFLPAGFCQRDIYICRGGGTEEYIPSFTYHGGKYVMVMGAREEQLTDESVTMLVMHSDLEEHGKFSCSDEMANALQSCARASDLANFVFFPTDCPHREKNGWTGDISLSAEHMIQNLDSEKSMRQWIRLLCLSQREDGGLPGIVPTAGWGYDLGPAWDSVLVEIPYLLRKYRGDLSLFRECAGAVSKYLRYLSAMRESDGLIYKGLGDWCHVMKERADGYSCPSEVSGTVYGYDICKKAEFLFAQCGMRSESLYAKELKEEFYRAFRQRLIDYSDLTVRGRCQGAQALAIFHGLFSQEEEEGAFERLVEIIDESGGHMDCGVLGLRVLFRTLAEHGRAELAYKMITRTEPPSYGFIVKELSACSMIEFLQRETTGDTTSFNHHFMCDISGFFITHIAGLSVNPNLDDPSFVRIQPSFIEKLTGASAYYKAVGGRVSVAWEKAESGRVIVVIERRGEVRGEIVAPDGYAFADAKERVRPLPPKEGRETFELSPFDSAADALFQL